MSHLRRLSAILLATVVLTGIPYLLLWHLSWPQLPESWAVAAAHLRGWRLPPGVPTALLVVALWVLWGLYAAGLTVEVLSRLRGLPRRLRPLGPLQAVAAAAVGTVALAPASAFADAVVSQDQDQDREEGGEHDQEAPAEPEEEASAQPTERARVVAGFEVGSADLTERMREDLAPVADMIDSYGDPESTVRITGHTDPSGSASANEELSERRARAVADHLGELLGEDAPGIETRGVGSEEPRDGDARAQRRVEVSYTVVPRQPTPIQPSEAAASTDTGSATDEEDERRVVVVEVPDGAVTGATAFAGLAGGYLLARRGVRVPSVNLSLPRVRSLPRHRRLALPAPPPRPTPGEEIDERVSVELNHVPGLGITGSGAKGAARRLIHNALDRLEPDAVRVLITEADALHLLGEKGRDLLRSHPCEPVRMVGLMEGALTELQRELHQEPDERRAPLVLVATPSPGHESALSSLLLHGQYRGITAVILGRWPLGGSCVIEEDGLITATSPPLNLVFHCSWPGSTASQVMDAVRAYRHSSPPSDGGAENERERAVPEPSDEEASGSSRSALAESSVGREESVSASEGPSAERNEPVPVAEESSVGRDEPAAAPEESGNGEPGVHAVPEPQTEGSRALEEPFLAALGAQPASPRAGEPEPARSEPEASPSGAAASVGKAGERSRGEGDRGKGGTNGSPEGPASTAGGAEHPSVPTKSGTIPQPPQRTRRERTRARPQEPAKAAAARPEPLTSRRERLERRGKVPRRPTETEHPSTESGGGDAQPSRNLPHKPKKAGRGRSWRAQGGS